MRECAVVNRLIRHFISNASIATILMYFILIGILKIKVMVSRDRPRWPKGFGVG